jgi:hypothetical protein
MAEEDLTWVRASGIHPGMETDKSKSPESPFPSSFWPSGNAFSRIFIPCPFAWRIRRSFRSAKSERTLSGQFKIHSKGAAWISFLKRVKIRRYLMRSFAPYGFIDSQPWKQIHSFMAVSGYFLFGYPEYLASPDRIPKF